MLRLLIITAVCSGGQSAVLIDRIAVIVGTHVVKASDVDRDLRVTSFVNRQQMDFSPTAKRKAADRLVDQQIIRLELTAQGYARATDSNADSLLKQIARDRFQGSEATLKANLLRYGLSEDQLREQLLWQLTVLSFIDQRFRPAVLVTDDDVRAYYDQHLGDLKRDNPRDNSFAAMSPKIRQSLEGQQIDKEFEAWLDQARKRNRIEYREAAFQ